MVQYHGHGPPLAKTPSTDRLGGALGAPPRAREEEAIERTVARRLIPLRKLLDAVAWSRDPHEIADELWVDVPTLEARIRGLHPSERAALDHVLAEHHTTHEH